MIKKIIAKYECLSCGTEFSISREFIVYEDLTKIEIPKFKCPCNGKKGKLLDVEIQ